MKKNGNGGFTLVELMIVVAIVAILSAVAYPSYTKYVVRGKRTAAASFIVSLANKQEQAMINSRAYQSTVAALNANAGTEVTDNYTISIAADNAAAPPTYTITAAPTGGQATNDTKCGSLTYTQAGVKGITGTGTVAECWK